MTKAQQILYNITRQKKQKGSEIYGKDRID
nr:MAG TPA: hypothetical protein [Caudoviricetes sp.]